MIKADFSKLDKLMGQLMPMLHGLIAEYGWVSGAPKYKDGIAVAKVASIQEARTGFFAKAIETFVTSHTEDFAAVASEVIAEKLTPEEGAKKLVEIASKTVVHAVDTEGLVDTGKLKDTIRWRVRGKGAKAATGKADP